MSVAFTKEESAETASETLLPERVISPHPNLVTVQGLQQLTEALRGADAAFQAAQQIEDVNERRRRSAIPLRDLRYLTERARTAQLMAHPSSTGVVAFEMKVTFRRADGRIQTYRIVGEDEADPKAGSISYVSPIAKLLLGRSARDHVGSGDREIEILDIQV